MGKSKGPTRADVRRQLDAIRQSDAFAGSERLMQFLTFVVEEALTGRGGDLKEAVVGNAIYGRKPPYDPRIDSTVRVEARRLRRKLDEYYAGPGACDALRISLPNGSYCPMFDAVPAAAIPAPAPAGATGILEPGSGVVVALLPFRAVTRLPEEESFAAGVTDELAFTLGGSPGFKMVARGATLQYRDRGYSPAELAAELKADAVLQGTVRIDGDTIRVTVEASDADGFVVWSDRFDAANKEGRQLQEAIAATLRSRTRLDSSRMRSHSARPGAGAVAAHAHIYRARQLLDQQTPASIQAALDLFEGVARVAVDSARGHAGIADCHCDLFRLGLIDAAAARRTAQAAAERALEIDSQSGEAYTSLATIAAWLDWDVAAAERGFEEALRHGDNARACRILGVIMTIIERHQEAEGLFREARDIEPFSLAADIAETVSHYQSRRFHRIFDAEQKHRHYRRAPLEAQVYSALAHAFEGRSNTARERAAELGRDCGRYPDFASADAEIEAWLGEPERAIRLVATPRPEASAFARATLAASVGDDAAALAAMEQSIDRRELSRAWFRTDIRFDRLRRLPAFGAQLRRLALARDPAAAGAAS